MDQREEFVKLNGEIGEIYQEDDWMIRFGFFCTGWARGQDAAEEIAELEAALKKESAKPATNSESTPSGTDLDPYSLLK